MKNRLVPLFGMLLVAALPWATWRAPRRVWTTLGASVAVLAAALLFWVLLSPGRRIAGADEGEVRLSESQAGVLLEPGGFDALRPFWQIAAVALHKIQGTPPTKANVP